MAPRQRLHERLKAAADSAKVYYQPPPSVQLEYPCIVYSKVDYDINHADDTPYITHGQYQVVAIYREPDSQLPEKILSIPWSAMNRHYAVNNLYHDVFTIYN